MSSESLSGVEYPHPFDDLVVELCDSASRRLCIQSPRLDHDVFDREELVTAISALARRSRQTEVRILIADSRPLVSRGHRLLELARRLPSSVIIQKRDHHPAWNGETVVVRDFDGVLYHPGGASHRSFYEPGSRASTQRHLELFNELWRYSEEDSDIRSFSV